MYANYQYAVDLLRFTGQSKRREKYAHTIQHRLATQFKAMHIVVKNIPMKLLAVTLHPMNDRKDLVNTS